MRDPHVAKLYYDVDVEGPSIVSESEPFETETAAFRISYEERRLRLEMIDHHPTVESARAAVAPFLRAWEIDDALRFGRPQIGFRFDRADVIDRNPPPPPKAGDAQVVGVSGVASAEAFGSAEVIVSRPFPKPPAAFATSPDVDTLFDRWCRYLAGREPLPGMAYFCLTVIEAYGGEADAARRYQVSRKVLSAIRKLCHSGDPLTARKAEAISGPLKAEEVAFLEAAVRTLIRRVGEVAADPGATFTTITMADLPKF